MYADVRRRAVEYLSNPRPSEHIGRMREYQRILEAHGIVVEMLVTQRPGYIVYEGAYQVAAYPFADTLCGAGLHRFQYLLDRCATPPGGRDVARLGAIARSSRGV